MGGLLTLITIEKLPDPYAGGLDLCGAVFDAPTNFTHLFDMMVVFQYYFPGVLPSPDKVPPDYEVSERLHKQMTALMQSKAQPPFASCWQFLITKI
jgi:hypothetical protein